MSWPNVIRSGLLPGALGGLAGGVVFSAAMAELGDLPSVAAIVRVESSTVGFAVHMAIAATVGSGLGLLVWHQRPGTGETLFWGMVYGTFWWFIGTLTLHPLFLGNDLAWDAKSAQGAFPALMGHVLYGSTAGLTIVLLQLRRRRDGSSMSVSGGALLRGALAGLLAASMIGAILAAQGQLPTFVARTSADSRAAVWLLTLLVGLLAGVGFTLLYPRSAESAGAGLIRGAMYGFLWWVVAPLSVFPVLSGSELPWNLNEVREGFPSFPGYVIFGAAVSVFYHWLGALVRLLFADTVAGGDHEGMRGHRDCVPSARVWFQGWWEDWSLPV